MWEREERKRTQVGLFPLWKTSLGSQCICLNINPHETLDFGKGSKRTLVRKRCRMYAVVKTPSPPPRKHALSPCCSTCHWSLLTKPTGHVGRTKSKDPDSSFSPPPLFWVPPYPSPFPWPHVSGIQSFVISLISCQWAFSVYHTLIWSHSGPWAVF